MSNLPQTLTPQPEPPPTSKLWGDMFGLGHFFKVLSDPTLVQQVHAMMGAIIEAAAANKRIEAKLDAVLQALGNDENVGGRNLTAVLGGNGANGARAHSAASGVVDDGDSSDAQHARGFE